MLKQEKDRVDAYLHHTTQEPLSKECYKFLLKQHQVPFPFRFLRFFGWFVPIPANHNLVSAYRRNC